MDARDGATAAFVIPHRLAPSRVRAKATASRAMAFGTIARARASLSRRPRRTMGDVGKTIAEKKDRFDAWLKAQSDAVRATRASDARGTMRGDRAPILSSARRR